MGVLDRFGDPIDEADDPHADPCDGSGWLDLDSDRPAPCPRCKADLVEYLRAQQRRRQW